MKIFSRLFQRGQEFDGAQPDADGVATSLDAEASASAGEVAAEPDDSSTDVDLAEGSHGGTAVPAEVEEVAAERSPTRVPPAPPRPHSSPLLSPTPRLVGGARVASASQPAARAPTPESPPVKRAATSGSSPSAPRVAPPAAPAARPVTTPSRPATAPPGKPSSSPAAAKPAPSLPRPPAPKPRPAPKPATTSAAPPETVSKRVATSPPAPTAPSGGNGARPAAGNGRAATLKDRPQAAPSKPMRKSDSISGALEAILDDRADGPTQDGVSSERDLAEVQRLFDELAAIHVRQVRNVMLELQAGDIDCAWMDSSKAALGSLRSMAEQMELSELCEALAGFAAAIDEAIGGHSRIDGDRKVRLLERYQRLIELIPVAFALDGERERREPIIVESLLRQVQGVEKLVIDKLFAVGLDRLETLMKANAGDIAVTAGIDDAVAGRIAERFRHYRDAVPASVAAPDAGAEQDELRGVVDQLKRSHGEYETASAGWSAECRERKGRARQQREAAFLDVRVALARLGEVDRLHRIEKLPYQQRIQELDNYLEEAEH